MSNLKIDSWEKSVKTALKLSLLTVIGCVIYTYVIMAFTGGETFVSKQPTAEVLNGISHNAALILNGVVMALIPVLLLRYVSAKYLLAYIPLNILFYLAIMFLCIAFIIDDNFDLLLYAVFTTPIGMIAGTAAAIIINVVKTKKYMR